MKKHGVESLPLACTEIGYAADWIPKGNMVLPFQDLLAAYIARVHVLGAAAGLSNIYWYSWDGLGGGLVERAGGLNRPGVAYAQTLRWLNGAMVNKCASKDDRLWICDLGMASRKAWMVWNTRETTPWVPPAEWHALQYETLDARLVRLGPGDPVQAGPAPVLVKSDSDLWSAYQTAPAENSVSGPRGAPSPQPSPNRAHAGQ
jgi:hypothetical protein